MRRKMPRYLTNFIGDNSTNEVRSSMTHTAELKQGSIYVTARSNGNRPFTMDLLEEITKFPALYELLKDWAAEDPDVMATLVEAEL